MSKLADLKAALEEEFCGEGKAARLLDAFDELTLEVPLADYVETARTLKNDPRFRFEQLLDLCGVDYSGYGGKAQFASRYAIVLHLISLRHNWRLRVRTQLVDVAGDEKAVAPTLVPVWDCANW
ncbi:MAG: NADH-quinone oxidoreductase subunit C, partial [Zoogloeaceae bacterium]|nr:NADH-quinone oxidoreductase subunit C [Zoogloeaceae bacterium]